MPWWLRNRKWLISFFIFFGLLLLMDSCLQFRMSKSEIDNYFKNKSVKGVLHHYDIGKNRINYLEAGRDSLPLVMFVHGSPGSLSAFIDFMADTTLLKYAKLITVDRPGFGSSDFGYAEPSLKKQAALLKPILEKHKNQQPVILVGHSLGGPVIARMAMDFPELVDGLILVAGSIDPELEPHEWFRAPLATPFLKWILPRSFRASNDEIYKLKPELQEMIPMWGKVKSATIVIQGTKDQLVAPGNADFAKKMMVNASVELMMLNDVNHFIPWSHPSVIREAVLKMVDRNKTISIYSGER